MAVVYHATDEPWNRREQFVASRQKLRTRNMRASARVLIKDFRSGRLTAQQVLDIFGMDEADILPPPDASDRIFEYGKQRNVHLLY